MINDKIFNCRRIRESKIKLSPSTVCEGLPSQFADYLTYVKKLNYAETPDYTYIKVSGKEKEAPFQKVIMLKLFSLQLCHSIIR